MSAGEEGTPELGPRELKPGQKELGQRGASRRERSSWLPPSAYWSRELSFSQLASHAGALFIPEIGAKTPGMDSEKESEERPSPVLLPLTREESWLARLLHPALRPLPELRAPKYVCVWSRRREVGESFPVPNSGALGLLQ